MKTKKDFATNKEFFSYLIANKAELIRMKKSAVKFTEPFSITESSNVVKDLYTNHKDNVQSGIITRTIIGNTYNWMDSVNDVLLPGVFSKSIQENADKIFHLHDHEFKTTSKVGKPTRFYEKSLLWADLGINKIGSTTALFMDSDIIKAYNEKIFNQYLNKEINQHSVGMQYVLIDLAINDSEEKAEYAVWTKYIDQIGNKEKAIEDGYFWAVKEGKLYEISAVLAGANELTPTLDNKSELTPIEMLNQVNEAIEKNASLLKDETFCSKFKKIKEAIAIEEEEKEKQQKQANFLTQDFIKDFKLF